MGDSSNFRLPSRQWFIIARERRKIKPKRKKNDNLAPATYTSDEETALLFQLSDELILEGAAQYGSWQEWQQASEAEGIGNISGGRRIAQKRRAGIRARHSQKQTPRIDRQRADRQQPPHRPQRGQIPSGTRVFS